MDAGLNQLRAELAGRYEVEQELGRGGMAVVYLAKDLRHQRRVAIKVLRSDLGSSGSERFLREIRTVAQLHHPHILQLLDSGTAGDHLFYVMPYVEGETLREKLEREGQLPVDEAVRIGREVADALDFAHGRGIVHRDVKPENIFLSAGHALVADFGIARAADAAKQGSGDATLTDVGLAVGTPAYMSPEQATADPRIDGRSDQYALGCVLYEMLAGQPPFAGPTSQAIMARHTADPVPPLRTVRAVPRHIESAIATALAKVPADRWPTMLALTTALQGATSGQLSPKSIGIGRWRSSVAIAAGLLGLAALTWIGSANRGEAQPDPVARTVLLLPFTLSGDSSQGMMADYLMERVTVGLAGAQGIVLKLHTLSAADQEPRQAGRQQGADAVMQARVFVDGNTIKVFPTLIDVRNGRTIWSQQFNGELAVEGATGDAFSIVDAITLQIVEALMPKLEPAQRALVQRGNRTRNAEALRLFLRARALKYVPADTGNLKIALLRRAVELDTTFADGWVALADAVEYVRTLQGVPAIEAVPEVRNFVNRAIEIDPQHSGAFALRARIAWFFDYDWQSALRDSRKAADLAPGSADAAAQLFWVLVFSSQADSALGLARRLVRADSTAALAWGLLSVAHRAAAQIDSSIAAGERAEAIDSTHDHLWDALVYNYIDRGRLKDAERIVNRFKDVDNLYYLNVHATYHERLGNIDRVRSLRDQLVTIARRQNVPPSVLAVAHLLAGDTAKALAFLTEASRIRDRALPVDFPLFWERVRGVAVVDSVRARVYGAIPVPTRLHAPLR
jgi:serine/threonine protein kinase